MTESQETENAPAYVHDHAQDEDCTVDPETNECIQCGTWHGDPCPDCGARAFHREDCPQMDPNYAL